MKMNVGINVWRYKGIAWFGIILKQGISYFLALSPGFTLSKQIYPILQSVELKTKE